MRHSFIDKYSSLDSLVHRLDPRTKVVTTLALVLAVLATPIILWPAFACYLALLVALVFLSRLPWLHVLKRSAAVLPFVLAIAIFIPFFKQGEVAGSWNVGPWQVSVTYNGLLVLANVVVKAWLAMLALVLLSSTTPLPRLLKGMEQLGMPRVMTMILSFMYRYLFVLADELMRMRQARDSRCPRSRPAFGIRNAGNIIGVLFIRSYERGERVYSAMVARGFDGQAKTLTSLQMRGRDWAFGGLVLLSLLTINLGLWVWL